LSVSTIQKAVKFSLPFRRQSLLFGRGSNGRWSLHCLEAPCIWEAWCSFLGLLPYAPVHAQYCKACTRVSKVTEGKESWERAELLLGAVDVLQLKVKTDDSTSGSSQPIEAQSHEGCNKYPSLCLYTGIICGTFKLHE